MKIKYVKSTLHLVKLVPKIFYNSKSAKTDSNVTNIREIYG